MRTVWPRFEYLLRLQTIDSRIISAKQARLKQHMMPVHLDITSMSSQYGPTARKSIMVISKITCSHHEDELLRSCSFLFGGTQSHVVLDIGTMYTKSMKPAVGSIPLI